MANPIHLGILSEGVEVWNKWRHNHLEEIPDLSETQLIEADFRNADFSNTNFRLAELMESNFSNANLTKADLTGADLRYANLTDANLTGADLRYAILADDTGTAANLTRAILREAFLSSRTDTVESGVSFFLDLACTTGLETVDFGDPSILSNYLEDAFEYAHIHGTTDAQEWPKLIEQAIQRIKLIHTLFPRSDIPPTDLVKVVQTINAEVIKQLARNPKDLYNLPSRGFEELIAEILSSYGWEVVLTSITKDGGYDIFAVIKNNSGLQTSWIVECKRYAPHQKIGIDIVRSLYGVKYDLRVGCALLATTSHFTKGVQDFKASRYDLELRDYEGILEWLNEYRPNPNGRLYIQDHHLVLPGA